MLKTVSNALRLIAILADSGKPLGVTQLGRAMKLKKSTVYRPLSTLSDYGYVRQRGDTELYELTLRLWEIGLKVLSRNDLKRVARLISTELGYIPVA